MVRPRRTELPPKLSHIAFIEAATQDDLERFRKEDAPTESGGQPLGWYNYQYAFPRKKLHFPDDWQDKSEEPSCAYCREQMFRHPLNRRYREECCQKYVELFDSLDEREHRRATRAFFGGNKFVVTRASAITLQYMEALPAEAWHAVRRFRIEFDHFHTKALYYNESYFFSTWKCICSLLGKRLSPGRILLAFQCCVWNLPKNANLPEFHARLLEPLRRELVGRLRGCEINIEAGQDRETMLWARKLARDVSTSLTRDDSKEESDQPEDSHQTETSSVFPFERLPPELRCEIFAHAGLRARHSKFTTEKSAFVISDGLLCNESRYTWTCCGGCALLDGESSETCTCILRTGYSTLCKCATFPFALLSLDRMTRSEALQVLWGLNTFHLVGDLAENLTFLNSIPKPARHHLTRLNVEVTAFFFALADAMERLKTKRYIPPPRRKAYKDHCAVWSNLISFIETDLDRSRLRLEITDDPEGDYSYECAWWTPDKKRVVATILVNYILCLSGVRSLTLRLDQLTSEETAEIVDAVQSTDAEKLRRVRLAFGRPEEGRSDFIDWKAWYDAEPSSMSSLREVKQKRLLGFAPVRIDLGEESDDEEESDFDED